MLGAYEASGVRATGRIARVDERGAYATLDDGTNVPAVRA